MKRGYQTKIQTRTLQKITHIQIITAGAILLALFMALSPLASASTYQAQINALKQKNATNQNKQDNLEEDAGTLAEKIARQQAEINALQSQINKNEAKDRKLKQDIAKAEQEIAYQRHLLGVSVKQMYLENEMSTLEMVASSKNLSEYVDREQYHTSVQNKLGDIMARINELKRQLNSQKKEVQELLKDQQAMQSRLNKQKAENKRLLSLNKQQQSAIDSRMRANSSKIRELQRLQAIENARYNVGKIQYGGTGGYPGGWAYAPMDTIVDTWGMYNRECVSYTAWKVSSTGRHMPYWGGRGNAKQWDDNARAAGIPTDYSPRPGDVAISNSGTYGHAMYVERVNGDGTVTVSQYNASWDGRYSVARRAVTGLTFIHF